VKYPGCATGFTDEYLKTASGRGAILSHAIGVLPLELSGLPQNLLK
jgi:hypothetical protein